jgi:ribonuclease D
MQIPTIITKTEHLDAFVALALKETYVTIDTEFIRERTYFARLCLVQIATHDQAVAIDPLAEGIDLSSLLTLLADPDVTKVFHAARQDLEIFYKLMQGMPQNIYDSQLAAMVCGYGESVSYEKLVAALADEKLDKASRFTDWAKRPLTDRQLHYALDDVIHLRVVYEKLCARIKEDGREEWIAEEMQALYDITRYAPNPQRAYKRLKVKSRAPEYLQTLRAVAAWRETRAIEKNIPSSRVLRDEVLLQIAAMKPESEEDLREVRGVHHQMSSSQMAMLIAQIDEARLAPKEDWPTPPPKAKSLTPPQESLSTLLRMLLKQRCDEAHVVPRLLVGRVELEAVVRGDIKLDEAHFMHGWRYEVFGRDASALLSGKLTVTAKLSGKGYGMTWRENDSAPVKIKAETNHG